MTLSKAGASVHTQHYNILWKGQLRSKASGTINKFAIMRHFHSRTSMQKQSQNLLFRKKKKTGEVSWTEAPLTPNLVPLGARRPQQAQTAALLLLASQIAVWVPFLVVCDWWSRQNPWLSFINSASIAPSIKIRKSARKDEPRALPLFTHEAPLSSVRLKE